MNKDFSMRFVILISGMLLVSVLISSCGGQESEIDLNDYPELKKYNEELAWDVDPVDYAAALTDACRGLVLLGVEEKWGLPGNTQDLCEDRFRDFYETNNKWPGNTGRTPQSYTFANGLAITLNIEDDFRGSGFVSGLQGLMNAQRSKYNWQH